MLQGSRGVTAPANQGRPANEGPANTVIAVAKCEFVVVEYFDTEGRRQKDTLLKVGDAYYTPPNSQAWAQSLQSVRPWLQDGVRQKLPVEGPVTVKDSVDILVTPGT